MFINIITIIIKFFKLNFFIFSVFSSVFSASTIFNILNEIHLSISTLYGSSLLLSTQAFAIARMFPNIIHFWDTLPSSSQIDIQHVLNQIESAIYIKVQITPPGKKFSSSVNINPRSTGVTPAADSLWSSALHDVIWDKQLSYLVLSGISIFPFMMIMQDDDLRHFHSSFTSSVLHTSGCNETDSTVLSSPEQLASLLEKLQILDHTDISMTAATGLSGVSTSWGKKKLRLDFRSFIESSTSTYQYHRASLCVLGILVHYLKTPIEDKKIIIMKDLNLNKKTELKSWSGATLRYLINLCSPSFQSNIIKSIRAVTNKQWINNRSSKTQRSTDTETGTAIDALSNNYDDEQKNTDGITKSDFSEEQLLPVLSEEELQQALLSATRVSFLFLLWRAVFYISLNRNHNLSASIKQTWNFCINLMDTIRSVKKLHPSINKNKFKFFNRLNSVVINLYVTLLRVAEKYSFDHKLNQLLLSQTSQILSSKILPYSTPTVLPIATSVTAVSKDCCFSPRSTLLPARCVSHSVFYSRLLTFTALSVLPTLFFRSDLKATLDLHQLLLLGIPGPEKDPIVWLFYLQQMRIICREFRSILPSNLNRRTVARNRSMIPVIINKGLNDACDSLEDDLRIAIVGSAPAAPVPNASSGSRPYDSDYDYADDADDEDTGHKVNQTEKLMHHPPQMMNLLKSIQRIVGELIINRLFPRDEKQVTSNTTCCSCSCHCSCYEAHEFGQLESNYQCECLKISRFPTGTPSYIMSSFNQLMESFVELLNATYLSRFYNEGSGNGSRSSSGSPVMTFYMKLPILTVGYLTAKHLIPLQCLNYFREILTIHRNTKIHLFNSLKEGGAESVPLNPVSNHFASQNQVHFSFVVSLLTKSESAKIVEVSQIDVYLRLPNFQFFFLSICFVFNSYLIEIVLILIKS